MYIADSVIFRMIEFYAYNHDVFNAYDVNADTSKKELVEAMVKRLKIQLRRLKRTASVLWRNGNGTLQDKRYNG